jgi:transforming growth factor-beta-induced protein
LFAPPTLIGIINSSPDFSILVEAIIAAGLIDTLEGGPFTVFAPTNEAFNKLDELLTDPGTVLRDILLYHIVPGNVLLNDLTNGPLTTVQGEDIAVTLNTFQGSTFVSSATLNGQSTTTSTDIVASNGVVFVIDTVLVPPSIAGPPADPTSAPSEIPSEAPSAAGPVGGQGPTTEPPTLSSDVPSVVPSVTPSMLPSDVPSEGPSSQPSVMTNPSAAMPTETLSAMPSLSPSMLSAAPSLPPTDLPSVAPTVLASSSPTGAPSSVPSTAPSRYPSISPSGIPSSVPSTTPSFSLSDTPSSVPSVLPSESLNPTSTPPHAYDLLSSSSEFTNLTSAIDVVGLENSFRGPGPFTVFAPTDDAFAKLPDGLLDALFLDIPTLRQIILYHVLSGELRRSTDFTTGDIFTIGDEPVSVQVSSNDITLNGSINITKADVVASNSLIHELDGVLIPPSLTA